MKSPFATSPDLGKGLIAGVVGGLAASFMMEQFQALWSKVSDEIHPRKKPGRRADPATVKMAQTVSKAVTGEKIPAARKPLAGEAVHYAMGAASGAIYGVATELAPFAAAGDGLAFGTSVWLAADNGIVPALGLARPAKEIPFSTHFYALASHLVYGFVAETVRQALRRAL
ncbi:MAG: DUF1440 domain-containing protein [Verrucomicrobiota bacterium]|nr:DUF1440 domain-containing protein [Verrucomicrobiota bacterium]